MRQRPGRQGADIGALAEVALAAARAGAAEHGRGDQAMRLAARKGGRTGEEIVTPLDVASEAAVTEVIRGRRPGDGVVGEEGTTVASQSGTNWYVDGVDGTANLVSGYPMVAVAVGAQLEDGRLVGAVIDLVRGVEYVGASGLGCWRDGSPVRVIDVPIEDAVISTGLSHRRRERELQVPALAAWLPAVRDIRRTGCPALDLAFVAEGSTAGHVESGLSPWDVIPGAALVEGAGGVARSVGSPATPREVLVAGSVGLVDRFVELLDPAGPASMN